jgi:hypothetical protein
MQRVILNFDNIINICKTYLSSLMKNKTLEFSLIDGLWIGHTYDLFRKLTLVEESLIARYGCKITLLKLRYSNNFLTCQKALKGNTSNFDQNHEAAMALYRHH